MKYLNFLFIFFIFSVSTQAETIKKIEPNSHFWLYFTVTFFLIIITFYFYSKTKYIEKNKKNAIYSLIFLLSLGSAYFLDLNYKKIQINNISSKENNEETSTKNKLKITKIRNNRLKEKLAELEQENIKLKLLEEKIKNSKKLDKNSILSEKDNYKSNQIKNNIKKIENDLLTIENNIEKVNSGEYGDNLVKEYSILQKLKNKKRQRELELQAKKRNLIDTNNSLNKKFSVNIDSELENSGLSKNEKEKFKTEYNNYKKELEKNNRKIILVKGKTSNLNKKIKQKKQKKESLEEKFFKKHYNFLVKKDFKKAYEESSKKIDFITYKNWYKDISKIVVNKVNLKKNTKNIYLVDLDIYDKKNINNYLVEKELIKLKNGNFKVKSSKTIKITPIKNKEKIIKNTKEKIDIKKITNIELKNILRTKNKKYLILDARENIERKTGYIKGSIFFRFAGLIEGNYKNLDKNKIIIVYTWEKNKSYEVAKFLKTLGFNVRYLENGVKGWLKFGGFWEGKKDVFKVYTNPKYKKKFTKKELEKEYKNGIYLVDARKKEDFDKSHLKGSYNIPLVYLAKNKWQKSIKQIPKDSKIVTICDSSINCFYAQVVGIEMAKVGYSFEGYYNLIEK